MNASESKESLVDQINHKTKRTLDIETSLTPANLAKCNLQLQSPLFTNLPPEVRDIIWRFASTPDEDLSKTYPETSYYYRPGHRAPHLTSTLHLSTCRLAWLEANAFPMQQSEHPFWLLRGPYDEHRPRHRSWETLMRMEYTRYVDTRRRFTKNNIQHISTLHLFVQMFELDRLASRTGIFEYPLPGPKMLHITIRQSDWWDWERDFALRMDEGRIRTILTSRRFAYVEVFKLELETIESKRDELDDIVARLEAFLPNAKDIDHNGERKTSQFIYDGNPKRWNWTRSPRLVDKNWSCFEGLPELRLHVVELKWHNILRPTTPPPDAEPPPTQTTYHLPPPPRHERHPLPPTLRAPPIPAPRFRTFNWRHGLTPRAFAWDALEPQMKENFTRWENATQAMRVHDVMLERFQFLMGGLEAERLTRQWKEQGSLLKFVEDE